MLVYKLVRTIYLSDKEFHVILQAALKNCVDVILLNVVLRVSISNGLTGSH